jgi:signal transduction histidine kinase
MMKGKYLVNLLFVFVSVCSLWGQNSDALKEKLNRNLPPEERLEVMRSLITLLLAEDKAQVKSVYLPMLHDEVTRSGNKEYLAYETEVAASLLYLGGQIDSARVQFARARDLYLAAGKPDKALNSWCRVGIMYSLKGDYNSAGDIYREVMASGGNYREVMAQVYNQMGSLFQYRGSRDSALIYYKKSTELYEILKDTAGMMRPMHNSAILLKDGGNNSEALELLMKVKAWRESRKMYRDLYNTLNAISGVFLKMGDYARAMDFAEQSYQYAMKQNNNALMISALGSISSINSEVGDYDSAVRYLEQARALAESTQSTDDQLSVMYKLGLVWLNAGRYDRAADILEKAQDMAGRSGPSRISPNILVSLGQAYLFLGRIGESRKILLQAIEISEKMGQGGVKNDAIGLMGRIYLRENNPGEAIRAATIAYESSLKEGFLNNQIEHLATLYEAHKLAGNYKTALLMHERYRALKDSVNSSGRVRQLTVKTQQFEFRLERERAAAEQQQRESALHARAIQNEIIAVSVGILAMLGLFFFLNVRAKNRIISRKNQELESLNSTKDQLFTIIGHDLRKPALSLRGISGKVNYLINRKEFDLLNKLGAQIEQQAQAMHQLTDNLLIWALSQRNTLKTKNIQFDIRELVKDALSPIEPLAQTKHVDLIQEVPELRTVSDPDILLVVVRNLSDNAVKFSKPGDTVCIGAGEIPGGFYIEIRDTGIGMSIEKIAGLFSSDGVRSESGTAGEKGAGLGLKLVKELTSRLGGDVIVTSTEGKGTTVRVEISKDKSVYKHGN